MDIFERHMFEDLVAEYEKNDLSDDDYEELFDRFSNLGYLEEVKPYLIVMRYLGLGTSAEPNAALSELKRIMQGNVELDGLAIDLRLCVDPQNAEALAELSRAIEQGYCGKYLKKRSNIDKVVKAPEAERKTQASVVDTDITDADDTIRYKDMKFEGCGYSGWYFTSGDIDYLHAKVFIEPMKAARTITVRSQIFAGDDAFSAVFSDEITLKPGDACFTTNGWGNSAFNCYGNRYYQWRIEIDGSETYAKDFRFYTGKIDKNGIAVKNVKLFASKASGAVEKDWNNCSSVFNSATLEYINFKLLFSQQGQQKNFRVHIKVDCLENGMECYNDTHLFHVESDWVSSWVGIGSNNGEKWNKGLYKYTVKIGEGTRFEGTFTVY